VTITVRFQKRNERETLKTGGASLRRLTERIGKAFRVNATSNAPSKIIGLPSNDSPDAFCPRAEALMK
jgi:hypothetical protein